MSNPVENSIALGNELHELCENVYYQPPENVKITYPCIIYQRATPDITRADNRSYLYTNRYTVVYIDRDPDNLTHKMLAELPFCHMTGNPYTKNNFYHYPYLIYR